MVISDLDLKFYVDGSLAETVPQTGLTLRSYDVVRVGSGVSSLSEAFFDNVAIAVTPVPEPTTWALVAVGAALMVFRRRTFRR